jgi:hypothetical protein
VCYVYKEKEKGISFDNGEIVMCRQSISLHVYVAHPFFGASQGPAAFLIFKK